MPTDPTATAATTTPPVSVVASRSKAPTSGGVVADSTPTTAAHYAPHFNSTGYCQCGCEECHLRLTGVCVCPDCPCDNPADDRHGGPAATRGLRMQCHPTNSVSGTPKTATE